MCGALADGMRPSGAISHKGNFGELPLNLFHDQRPEYEKVPPHEIDW